MHLIFFRKCSYKMNYLRVQDGECLPYTVQLSDYNVSSQYQSIKQLACKTSKQIKFSLSVNYVGLSMIFENHFLFNAGISSI